MYALRMSDVNKEATYLLTLAGCTNLPEMDIVWW